MSDTAPAADLTGWRRTPFTGAGHTHDCYEKGEGPGVVLIPELPGVTPQVLGLAEHLVEAGFTVVVPSPFGTPGKPLTIPYVLGEVARVCVSAEFRAFTRDAARPFTAFLRAVSQELNARTPGRGVGVIGMCFTGGFALAAAVDDAVRAPVLSQPSLPFPISGGHRRDLGISATELDLVKARTTTDGLCLLGLRFSADKAATAERFAGLREQLGEAFEVIELDSSPGNAGGFKSNAHSVLTGEVREEPPNQAYAARERMVTFLRENLTPPGQ